MPFLGEFDARNEHASVARSVIPAGRCSAVITASETKKTRAGDGSYLQVAFQVSDGDHAGRTVWSRLSLDSPSASVVRIARAELAAICRAVGVSILRDTRELHERRLQIEVGVRKREHTGESINVITAYFPALRQQR